MRWTSWQLMADRAVRRSRWIARCIGPVVGLAALALPVSAAAAVSLPGAPPVSASAFPLEAAGRPPVDNDRRIPAPATPPRPVCSVTLTAPAGGAVTQVQQRIDADVAAGSGFTGDTICLSGIFRQPLHVRGKASQALLTIAAAPGTTATFDLSGRPPQSSDEDPSSVNPNEIGAIEIGGSRDVELYGLTIEHWISSAGATFVPAGIYVWERHDSGGTSPCFTTGDKVCSDIFLFNNTVTQVGNTTNVCSSSGVINGYGIAIKSFGLDSNRQTATHELQHLVIEGNTVTHTFTGQSETVAVDGNVAYFLVANNTISQVNNIGLDVIGWELSSTSASQAREGLITANSISNVDNTTDLNGYGHLVNGVCQPGDDAAAGLYVDGGSTLWLQGNTVTDTNHGIELGAENQVGPSGATADHLLVAGNTVSASRGTTYSGTSYAGHAYDALIIDGGAAGRSAFVDGAYVHGNRFTNASQFYNNHASVPFSKQQAAVVVLDNRWENVWLLGNTVSGGGSADVLNPILNVNTSASGTPTTAPGSVVDCNVYAGLSTTPAPSTADNFDTPTKGWGLFSGDPTNDYSAQNRMPTSELGLPTPNRGWDHDSATAAPAPCPFTLPG